VASSDASQTPWAVAVFAHNEESHIVSCLESIAVGAKTHPIQAYVLANGCTDRTGAVVSDYAKSHPWVTLVSITTGDKSNTWNVFVNEVAPQSEVCFFVDGDVQVLPGAFDELFLALQHSPEANAAAAVPFSGRNQKGLREFVCKHHFVLGNLYALRDSFVRRVRELGVRLPVGYIGDDGLVTSLSKWNLDPTGPFIQERVAPCPSAQFEYQSLSPWSIRDWRLYLRRRVRYSLRHFQHELLKPLLIANGLAAMPNSMATLYQQQAELLRQFRPRGGADAIFDRIALSRMRKQLSDLSPVDRNG
jgi:glycosyltransferase involved in cell wall biosynthesis